jgi:hypothetical protein
LYHSTAGGGQWDSTVQACSAATLQVLHHNSINAGPTFTTAQIHCKPSSRCPSCPAPVLTGPGCHPQGRSTAQQVWRVLQGQTGAQAAAAAAVEAACRAPVLPASTVERRGTQGDDGSSKHGRGKMSARCSPATYDMLQGNTADCCLRPVSCWRCSHTLLHVRSCGAMEINQALLPLITASSPA